MKALVDNFPNQLKDAIAIGENASLSKATNTIDNVVICGLGGSGIGGTIVTALVSDGASVPVNVCKGYFLPNYVNENTLVIISSYSGNTEETLNCLEEAINKGATITAITSGGAVSEKAQTEGFDCIIVPGGMPPRSCLGYSFTQLFYILGHHKIIDNSFNAGLQKSVELLNEEKENIISEAAKLAKTLKGKLPVIYSTTNNEGIAVRFRQQLNENSKVLCWHHAIPEMNHNELVGWTEKNDDLAVIIFLDNDEYERNLSRVKINTDIIKNYASSITEVYSKGGSAIEKAMYLIHLGDWISVLLAELRGVDAVEVNVIDKLKSKLASLN